MSSSARQNLCPRGLRSAARCATLILASTLAAPVLPAVAHASAAAHPSSAALRRPKPPPPCADTNLQPSPANLARVDAATLCLIERIRAAAHLRTLHTNGALQGVATGQAYDMVAGDYFADNSLSGQTPLQRILATPYPRHAAAIATAQNIGWATGTLATPSAMVAAWMTSPPHREIVLTAAYRDVGVGVTAAAPPSLAAGQAGATYTLEFGERIFAAHTARRVRH